MKDSIDVTYGGQIKALKNLEPMKMEVNYTIEEKMERLQNTLDNIGYQIEGIIRKTDDVEINKATGEILAKHNIELLKKILKMIVNKDVSIRSDKE